MCTTLNLFLKRIFQQNKWAFTSPKTSSASIKYLIKTVTPPTGGGVLPQTNKFFLNAGSLKQHQHIIEKDLNLFNLPRSSENLLQQTTILRHDPIVMKSFYRVP